MKRPLRVTWVGLRGFPGVQGGVETHAEQLCPLLVQHGCEVRVLTRSGYQPDASGPAWRGVFLDRLWAPESKHFEALVHTFLAVTRAAFVHRPDVLHIQAIGPALMTVWARMLGLRVVVTHHGPDYDRQKWGRIARYVLRLGEAAGARCAHKLIVISNAIRHDVMAKHGRAGILIPNGVTLPAIPTTSGALEPYGLHPGRYVLLVSRLVPEKRHLDLIEAFRRARMDGWKLVIVGAADHADTYSARVAEAAALDPVVVMTGFQSGLALREFYAHAGVFVLPSSHEGLPIALLEALSFGLRTLASAIPANLEVGLPDDCYFPLGDTARLASLLQQLSAASPIADDERERRREWVAGKFSWERSASATLGVYEQVAGQGI